MMSKVEPRIDVSGWVSSLLAFPAPRGNRISGNGLMSRIPQLLIVNPIPKYLKEIAEKEMIMMKRWKALATLLLITFALTAPGCAYSNARDYGRAGHERHYDDRPYIPHQNVNH